MKKLIHEPYFKFKVAMKQKGHTYRDGANLINVSLPTFFRKVNGKSDFYISEIITLLENGYTLDLFLP